MTDEGLRKRRRRYTNVSGEAIDSKDLDLRDLGLLVMMLSKPDGWTFSAKRIANERPCDGETFVGTGLRHLAEHGYYRVERRRLLNGEFRMGNAVSEEPVESWVEDFKAFAGKPATLIQQSDGSFMVKRPDGSLVSDGFDPQPDPNRDSEEEFSQVGPDRGFPDPVFPDPEESDPGNPGSGDAGSGEPPPKATTEGATTESNQPPSGVGGAHASARTREEAPQQPLAGFPDGQNTDPPPKSGKGRQRRKPWPGQFAPSDAQVAWAGKHYRTVDVDFETRAFNAYFDAPEREGVTRDWAASWREWVKKAAERGPSRRPAASPQLVELATPTVDAWCTWWGKRGAVTHRARVDLMVLVVGALQAGATIEQVKDALKECNEVCPAPFRFQNALLGVSGGPNKPAPGNVLVDPQYDGDDQVHAERREFFR